MNKLRLFASICAAFSLSMLLVQAAKAAIVTYSFENSNFSGYYSFNRDAADVSSFKNQDGGYTTVRANTKYNFVDHKIDYKFEVNLPQFGFSEVITPDDGYTAYISNEINHKWSRMMFSIEDPSQTKFRFDLPTIDLIHPYDPGSNPLDQPPPFDYFFSDYEHLNKSKFFADTITLPNGSGVIGSFIVNGASMNNYLDSNLVTVNASLVPIPPAVWLFGSGLLGLLGVARRKS